MGNVKQDEGLYWWFYARYSIRQDQRIGVEKFDNTKTLIDTDDELPDDITLKYVVISMACIIKDENKFYP